MQNKDRYNHFLKYFHNELYTKVPRFISRFKGLNFHNQKIIDLGCGLGALSVFLSKHGAREIIGLDINKNKLKFAKNNLLFNFPELNNIHFVSVPLNDLEDHSFNMIISKASFEHIMNLKETMALLKDKLVPGGKIVAGFGPLYNSPWGDHNRLQHKIPWGHLFFPGYFIKRLNKNRKNKISSIHDIGLNGLSLKDYKRIFNHTEGLRLVDFRTNVSEKPLMKIFNMFSKLPFLKEYFTYNIYCTLERYQ